MTESATSTETGHEVPSYDDINTPVILLVGAISALVTLITIMFVQGLCYHWQNNFVERRSQDVENLPAVVQINQQKAALAGDGKTVSIDDAMANVVAKYGKSSSQ